MVALYTRYWDGKEQVRAQVYQLERASSRLSHTICVSGADSRDKKVNLKPITGGKAGRVQQGRFS